MIPLKDCTFIVPIRLESEDREKNLRITLSYLCKHLETNIIMVESASEPKAAQIIEEIENCGSVKTKITYLYIKDDSEVFHRTKLLNLMLSLTKTNVVVNYDTDILLEPKTYLDSYIEITKGCDLYYPYFFGDSQKQINHTGRHKVTQELSLENLQEHDFCIAKGHYGHCQFFNTKSYIEGGFENENFISYAPEDEERAYRFQKLGYKVEWGKDFVMHLEHSRGINSGSSNPMFQKNNELFEFIKSLDEEQLKWYYQHQEYLKKYKI